jgi:probable HAF family extracellular repeat protein
MNMTRRYAAAILSLAAATATAQAQQYVVTDMGILPGFGSSTATSINDRGQVVGYSSGADQSARAMMWSNGQLRDLGTVGGNRSIATSINNNGVVVGYASVSPLDPNDITPIIYQNGTMQPILANDGGRLFGSASDINDRGDIVGSARNELTSDIAFVRRNGQITSLGTLNNGGYSGWSSATSINRHGTIVGSAQYFGQSQLGVVWQNGVITSTNIPRSPASVNDNGIVAGHDVEPFFGAWSVPYTTDIATGSHTNIPTLGGSRGYATSINNSNVVVGQSTLADNTTMNAFIFKNGTTTNLNSLVSSNTGYTITHATAINNRGQIVGSATRNGESRAVLLTPLQHAPRDYQVPPQLSDDDEISRRLERWDKHQNRFVSVSADDSHIGPTTPVYVIAHGWGRGLRDEVNAHPLNKAWELYDDEASGAWGAWMGEMASAINSSAIEPDAVVIGYSWIDESATTSSSSSQNKTENSGRRLARLIEAVVGDGYEGDIHLIGHSHGSKVAAVAALKLKENPTTSLSVARLTLLDSPEVARAQVLMSANHLDDVLTSIGSTGTGIGISSGQTFVDNYYSEFGREYEIDGVVNVALQGRVNGSWSDQHSYSYKWLGASGTSQYSQSNGLFWQSTGAIPGSTAFRQDWWETIEGPIGSGSVTFEVPKNEFSLLATLNPAASRERKSPSFTLQPLNSNIFNTDGTVIVDAATGRITLIENSPSFVDMTFVLPADTTHLQVSFEVLSPGDGDLLGLWINNELLYSLTLSDLNAGLHVAYIGIEDVTPNTLHFLTIGLHSTGEPNSAFVIDSLSAVIVPEPTSIALLGLMSILMLRSPRANHAITV